MIGIDEVGRGCWAGPLLVVAARQVGELSPLLADSKVLSKKKRQALMHPIEQTCQLGEGWVEPAEIDALGLTAAMRLAVKRALQALDAQPNEPIIMDGNFNYCPAQYLSVACVVDADADYPIVSAASIYAKVKRDQFMTDLAVTTPGYGFEKHVGYGTKAHIDALKKLGVSSNHRKSYKPIQALL
ncbi:MAG: ribonuclease HII [Candidatus Saccharimonadales bacterium]